MYKRLDQGHEKLKLDDIKSLLCLFCRENPRTCFLLDALDECDSNKQRGQIISLLKTLVNASAKLLIMSRPHPQDIHRSFEGCTKLEIVGNAFDIRSYVKQKIEMSDELSELIDVNLKEEIVDRVTSQASNMLVIHSTSICVDVSPITELKNSLGFYLLSYNVLISPNFLGLQKSGGH